MRETLLIPSQFFVVCVGVFAFFVLSVGTPVLAQQSEPPSGPIEITADSLSVDDAANTAVFNGSVVVKQAGTVMTTPSLQVFYTDTAAQGASQNGDLSALGSGAQDIDKLEAAGPVVVTQNDQTARGDFGVYDAKTEIVTLTGNVMLKQGQNVIRGDKLIVNLKTQKSRVVSGSGRKGRVRAVIVPGETAPQQTPKPL